jgi:uncharacterized protein
MCKIMNILYNHYFYGIAHIYKTCNLLYRFMTIIILSDIHGKNEEIEKIADDLKKSDLVLLCGDITHFGKEQEIKQIISQISTYQTNILSITGNYDFPEVEFFLSKEGISIDKKCAIYNGIGFIGAGGSLPCPGETPNEFTENEFDEALSLAFSSLYSPIPAILATHQPPYGTNADMAKNGEHVGSKSIRKHIQTNSPIACFCGHIHEAKGRDKIDQTVIVNPGALKDGNYAFVKIANASIEETLFLSV